MMRQVFVEGSTINEAWFRTIKACMLYGHDYKIDRGEYEGQIRKEFESITITINKPWIRPLACSAPNLTPTTDEKIESYFWNYLMDPDFKDDKERENNEYKYASWISLNWQGICDALLVGSGGCNQAVISLGCLTEWTHPPCLRMAQLKVFQGSLRLYVVFRSWDLVSGFPENLGGLQRFKEYCLQYLNEHGANLKDGEIIASSIGLHIYDHFLKLVDGYVGNTLEDTTGIHCLELGV